MLKIKCEINQGLPQVSSLKKKSVSGCSFLRGKSLKEELRETPYSAHVVISFWCDSDNKNYDFFTFQNFSGYFSFVHFSYY